MDDVRGLFLGMPHDTTPAVTTNKNIIMSSFKSSRDIQKKEVYFMTDRQLFAEAIPGFCFLTLSHNKMFLSSAQYAETGLNHGKQAYKSFHVFMFDIILIFHKNRGEKQN